MKQIFSLPYRLFRKEVPLIPVVERGSVYVIDMPEDVEEESQIRSKIKQTLSQAYVSGQYKDKGICETEFLKKCISGILATRFSGDATKFNISEDDYFFVYKTSSLFPRDVLIREFQKAEILKAFESGQELDVSTLVRDYPELEEKIKRQDSSDNGFPYDDESSQASVGKQDIDPHSSVRGDSFIQRMKRQTARDDIFGVPGRAPDLRDNASLDREAIRNFEQTRRQQANTTDQIRSRWDKRDSHSIESLLDPSGGNELFGQDTKLVNHRLQSETGPRKGLPEAPYNREQFRATVDLYDKLSSSRAGVGLADFTQTTNNLGQSEPHQFEFKSEQRHTESKTKDPLEEENETQQDPGSFEFGQSLEQKPEFDEFEPVHDNVPNKGQEESVTVGTQQLTEQGAGDVSAHGADDDLEREPGQAPNAAVDLNGQFQFDIMRDDNLGKADQESLGEQAQDSSESIFNSVEGKEFEKEAFDFLSRDRGESGSSTDSKHFDYETNADQQTTNSAMNTEASAPEDAQKTAQGFSFDAFNVPLDSDETRSTTEQRLELDDEPPLDAGSVIKDAQE